MAELTTPTVDTTPTIELSGLEVHLGGRQILRGLSGKVHSRAIGLLGPNGAGKSTLINTLLGFHSPSSGTARVLGLDVRTARGELRSLVGYMPENDAFRARDTGVHFVRYMAEISGLPRDLALERAHQAFLYVGLGEVRYRKLGTYSLGMKQLAKFAQAISHGPRLLILDEPTNGLDPPGRKRMIGLIREIREAGDTHLLISSHLLHDIEETCEEVLILRDGGIAGIVNLEEERKANRRFLEMELIGPGAEFTASLAALGCECAGLGGSGGSGGLGASRLRVILPAGIEIQDVYRVAAEQQARIRRMNYRRDSLEDIFLNAMGQAGGPNGRL